jgi:hypothetical protein
MLTFNYSYRRKAGEGMCKREGHFCKRRGRFCKATVEKNAEAFNKEKFLRTKYYQGFHKGQYSQEYFKKALEE